MKKFEIGKKYYTRSICDSDCKFIVEIARRTEKTVTVIKDGREVRCKIAFDGSGKDEHETIMPWGRYSFAPVIRATRELVPEPEQTAEEIRPKIFEGAQLSLNVRPLPRYN